MIKAVEVQERVVELKHPVMTGVYLGIGFIAAPFVLLLFISAIAAFLVFVTDLFG